MENKKIKILWGIVIFLILAAAVSAISIYADRKLQEKKMETATENAPASQSQQTAYGSTEHRDGVVHAIKEDAMADTTDEFYGKTTE